MDRRDYLKTMIALGTVGLFDRVGLAGKKVKQPNVLIVMTDEHRCDCLGCYGNETPIALHQDALFHRLTDSTATLAEWK